MKIQFTNKRREFLTEGELNTLESIINQYGNATAFSQKCGFTLNTLYNITSKKYGNSKNIRAIRKSLKEIMKNADRS